MLTRNLQPLGFQVLTYKIIQILSNKELSGICQAQSPGHIHLPPVFCVLSLHIKCYLNTDKPLYICCGFFLTTTAELCITTEPVWSAKLNIFTIWLFTEKFGYFWYILHCKVVRKIKCHKQESDQNAVTTSYQCYVSGMLENVICVISFNPYNNSMNEPQLSDLSNVL